MQNERRSSARQRSFLGAQLAPHARASTQPCLVRDISPDGARLRFPDSVMLPQEITLSIPHAGLNRRARIVWRSASEMGVRFTGPAHGGADIVSLREARKARQMRQENEALRRRVEQLTSGA